MTGSKEFLENIHFSFCRNSSRARHRRKVPMASPTSGISLCKRRCRKLILKSLCKRKSDKSFYLPQANCARKPSKKMQLCKKNGKSTSGDLGGDDHPAERGRTTQPENQGRTILARQVCCLCLCFTLSYLVMGGRVAELGSLSSGAERAMKISIKRVFKIFVTKTSF